MVDGTELSASVREAILHHPGLSFQGATNAEGIFLPRSIIENVAHGHSHTDESRDIVRAIQPLKPALSEDDYELRVEFCVWALEKLKEGAIFIFSDETYIE